jgi:hypothetical protein
MKMETLGGDEKESVMVKECPLVCWEGLGMIPLFQLSQEWLEY